MSQNTPQYTQKQLTELLRKVAAESISMDDSGELITYAEKLARVVWQKAVGYTETQYKNGETFEKIHPPAAWAIQMLMDRLEGKVTTVSEEGPERLSAADRVGALCVSTVNNLTEEVAPQPKGPPPIRPKSEDSDDG